MDYKEELTLYKDEIDYITFKLTFYKGYYALKMVDKEGYVMTTSQGEFKIDIHESEIENCVNWCKANGFKISKYSVVR